MSDHTYAPLLAALARTRPGEDFTVDTWRDEANCGWLTSAEKAAAHERAIRDGYLVRVLHRRGDGRYAAVSIPSDWPPAKGRGVQLHTRTGKPVPGHGVPETHREPGVCDGQTDLLEEIGA